MAKKIKHNLEELSDTNLSSVADENKNDVVNNDTPASLVSITKEEYDEL